MAAKKAANISVVVTTPTRDVWWGHCSDVDATPLVLTGARHCYRWGVQRGLGQLAQTGPGAGHQIGEVVGEVRVRAIACVLVCSAAATTAFEAATWSR